MGASHCMRFLRVLALSVCPSAFLTLELLAQTLTGMPVWELLWELHLAASVGTWECGMCLLGLQGLRAGIGVATLGWPWIPASLGHLCVSEVGSQGRLGRGALGS